MNRHSKAKALLIISGFFAIVICSFWSARINANPMVFQEGKQFKKFAPAVYDTAVVEDLIKKNPDKIKVFIFYAYACHWCQQVEPKVAAWSKNLPANTLFYHVPVSFQPGWRSLAKIYFAAEQLKVLDKIHEPMFEAVKNDELANTKDETIFAFVAKQGVDKKAFSEAYHSFLVDSKTRWANNLAVSFKITAIPTFVVVGPKEAFYTQTALAGDETNLFNVLNFLIHKQQQQLKKG
jgi:thiol:disulfide interchange protein DsbA